MDTTKHETDRAWRLTNKGAECFSFKVPRKGNAFSEDIYPPVFIGEFSNSFEEWAQGIDKDPIVQPFS